MVAEARTRQENRDENTGGDEDTVFLRGLTSVSECR